MGVVLHWQPRGEWRCRVTLEFGRSSGCNYLHASCFPQEEEVGCRRSAGGLMEDEIEWGMTGEVECRPESICCWDGGNLQKDLTLFHRSSFTKFSWWGPKLNGQYVTEKLDPFYNIRSCCEFWQKGVVLIGVLGHGLFGHKAASSPLRRPLIASFGSLTDWLHLHWHQWTKNQRMSSLNSQTQECHRAPHW